VAREAFLVALDTVVLDVDGTLVDSVYARTIAWKAAFREVGVEVASHRIHRAIGMGGDRVVAHLAGESAAQGIGAEVRKRHAEHFERLIPDITATDGAAELLSLLRERGLNVVIASSGEPALVSRLLELVDGGPGLVHRIVWGTPTMQTKPAPDLFHAAVAQVGGTEAVVVGDSVWDTQAARAAGLPCLAVRTGGFCDAELLDQGAIAVYESPRELLKAPELVV
jgi:HAD superfamily hydrolase (TIGR01549 family)